MKLSQIFKQILVDAEVFFDSDNDGISDYHEKKIAQNQMRLSSGAEIPGYKHIDYLNPDSDGDLLEDGQEMKIVTTERGVFVRLNSSPFLPDTDNDGFDDYAEDLMGTSSFDENAPGFHEYNISEMSLGAQGRQKSYQSGGGSGGGVYGYKGTGTVMSNNPLLLTPISFKDWFKMAMEEYFWSYIHRQVQEHIYDNNANLQIEYVIPATQKKCDVVNLPKTMIWEVKPVSYYFDSLKNEEGKKQLENYVNLMNNVKKILKQAIVP